MTQLVGDVVRQGKNSRVFFPTSYFFHLEKEKNLTKRAEKEKSIQNVRSAYGKSCSYFFYFYGERDCISLKTINLGWENPFPTCKTSWNIICTTCSHVLSRVQAFKVALKNLIKKATKNFYL